MSSQIVTDGTYPDFLWNPAQLFRDLRDRASRSFSRQVAIKSATDALALAGFSKALITASGSRAHRPEYFFAGMRPRLSKSYMLAALRSPGGMCGIISSTVTRCPRDEPRTTARARLEKQDPATDTVTELNSPETTERCVSEIAPTLHEFWEVWICTLNFGPPRHHQPALPARQATPPPCAFIP